DRPRRVTPAERAAYARRAAGDGLTEYAEASGAPVLDLAALARRWMVPADALRAEAERSPALRVVDAAPALAWTAERERDAHDRLRRLVDGVPVAGRVVPYDRLARALGVPAAHVQPLLRSLLARDGAAGAAGAALPLRLDRAAAVVHPGRTDL